MQASDTLDKLTRLWMHHALMQDNSMLVRKAFCLRNSQSTASWCLPGQAVLLECMSECALNRERRSNWGRQAVSPLHPALQAPCIWFLASTRLQALGTSPSCSVHQVRRCQPSRLGAFRTFCPSLSLWQDDSTLPSPDLMNALFVRAHKSSGAIVLSWY